MDIDYDEGPSGVFPTRKRQYSATHQYTSIQHVNPGFRGGTFPFLQRMYGSKRQKLGDINADKRDAAKVLLRNWKAHRINKNIDTFRRGARDIGKRSLQHKAAMRNFDRVSARDDIRNIGKEVSKKQFLRDLRFGSKQFASDFKFNKRVEADRQKRLKRLLPEGKRRNKIPVRAVAQAENDSEIYSTLSRAAKDKMKKDNPFMRLVNKTRRQEVIHLMKQGRKNLDFLDTLRADAAEKRFRELEARRRAGVQPDVRRNTPAMSPPAITRTRTIHRLRSSGRASQTPRMRHLYLESQGPDIRGEIRHRRSALPYHAGRIRDRMDVLNNKFRRRHPELLSKPWLKKYGPDVVKGFHNLGRVGLRVADNYVRNARYNQRWREMYGPGGVYEKRLKMNQALIDKGDPKLAQPIHKPYVPHNTVGHIEG